MKSPSVLTYLFSCLLLFSLLFLLLKIEEQIYIVFCHLYIFHILLRLPVLGIGLFLFLKDFAVFLIQFFDLRKFTLDLGESFLSSFTKSDTVI